MASKFDESVLDDDSGDEDLFKPSGLTVTKKTSDAMTVSQDSSVEESPTVVSVSTATKKALAPEEIEEKALRDAKFAVGWKLDYKSIRSTSLLKWLCIKNQCMPCFVCPNADEALAGHDNVKLTKKNNTLVRFMGYYYLHRDKIQAVPEKQLKAYSGEENDFSEWSSSYMRTFLTSIKKQKEFNGDERDLKLRTEELFLQLVLASVLECEKQQQQQEQHLAEGSAALHDEDESDDDLPNTATTKSPSPSSATCRSSPLAASICAATQAATFPTSQIKRLRAGDCIEYYPPHLVAGNNMHQSIVVECIPGDDLAVRLSTGEFLQRDHQIRIAKRYLRGKYEDNPGASFISLRDCVLDKSQNGQVKDVPTLAEELGKVYKEAMEEMSAFQQAPEADGSSTSQVRVNGVQTNGTKESEEGGSAGQKRDSEKAVGSQSNKKVKLAVEPEWKRDLDELLAECALAKKRRRADFATIEVNEAALKMAIAVRQCLDDMLSKDSTRVVEDLVDDVAEELLCSSERLWDYLNGNPKNLISVAALKEVTSKWKAWIDRTS